MSAPTLEKILQAVNVKYGTSFEGWSQLPTAYEVGDTVPNWNAYEKIRMNNMKVAVDVGYGGYVLGLVNNGIFTMCVVQNGNAIIINQDGRIAIAQASAQVMFEDYAKNVFVEQGFQINGVQSEVVEVSQGDIFPNYQDYLFIP